MHVRTLWPALTLTLAACAGPAPEATPAATSAPTAPAATAVASASPASAPTQICTEDTPTGTRFSRVRCVTPQQEAERLKNGERVADEMRNMRPAARDMSR